jgi:membrane-associated phospholipid phosphatase
MKYFNSKAFLIAIIFCLVYTNSSGQNKTLEHSGDALLLVLPTSAVVATLIHKDKKGTIQFVKSFLLNAAITYGLKGMVDKERPDLRDHNSFPSGHTSATFQSASFLQRRYGWEYGIPAYALAGFTAFTRVNAKKHDGWDVLVGAAIGIGSTYIFATPYQQEHFELTYETERDQHLISFKYKF